MTDLLLLNKNYSKKDNNSANYNGIIMDKKFCKSLEERHKRQMTQDIAYNSSITFIST